MTSFIDLDIDIDLDFGCEHGHQQRRGEGTGRVKMSWSLEFESDDVICCSSSTLALNTFKFGLKCEKLRADKSTIFLSWPIVF